MALHGNRPRYYRTNVELCICNKVYKKRHNGLRKDNHEMNTTDNIRKYAKMLLLGNLGNNCADITRAQLMQMRQMLWLEQVFNFIFMGPCRTGKTFMTAGLVRDDVGINIGYNMAAILRTLFNFSINPWFRLATIIL
jgi:DNA replication protein DnaC